MSRQYEVTAIVGKYTDSEGNEKNKYLTIGSVIQTRNGLMVKLDAIPTGWDGWAYLNEPREQGQKQSRQAPPRRGGYD